MSDINFFCLYPVGFINTAIYVADRLSLWCGDLPEISFNLLCFEEFVHRISLITVFISESNVISCTIRTTPWQSQSCSGCNTYCRGVCYQQHSPSYVQSHEAWQAKLISTKLCITWLQKQKWRITQAKCSHYCRASYDSKLAYSWSHSALQQP